MVSEQLRQGIEAAVGEPWRGLERKQLKWMFHSAFELKAAVEKIDLGRKPVDAHDLNNLIQDLLMQFDEVHHPAWNVFTYLYDDPTVWDDLIIEPPSLPKSPFAALVKRFELLERQAGTRRMVPTLFLFWSDVAACLSACFAMSPHARARPVDRSAPALGRADWL